MTPDRPAQSPLLSISGLSYGARFVGRLPAFLRTRLTAEDARATHAQALSQRHQRFLAFVQQTGFERADSVLGQLLAHAGVTFADLEELVSTLGLEGALLELFRHGVYVTVDEFKGRTPIVRGSLKIDAGPAAMRNPLARFHVAAQSGGSRSRAAPFLIDLSYIRACASVMMLHFEAVGISGCAKATWETPGAGSRFRLLKHCTFGDAPDAWFTPVDPKSVDPVFRWSERAMRFGGRLAGVRLPPATMATREDPMPVAEWMRGVLDRGGTPHLHAHPTAVVALSLAAVRSDIDLSGAFATLMGEPTTTARLQTVRESGITGLPRYGSIEAGPIGYACLNPSAVDDVHLVRDLHALIQPGEAGVDAGLPSEAILLTALHPAAPFAMLNFSMGDEAVVETADCDCPLSALGWTLKLHHVRSFEKFTAAGVTFDYREIVRLLEQTLPSQFGGGPADFQLIEDEDDHGEPTLALRVHPRVGELNEPAVCDAFYDALGSGSPVARVMQRALADSVELRIERGTPHLTRSGKFTHLHVRTG